MKAFRFLPLLALLFALPGRADDLAERARRLAEEAIIFDAHCDTVLAVEKGRDLGVRNQEGHLDIPRMREGGLDMQVFALWPEPEYYPERSAHRTLQLLDVLANAVSKNPQLQIVTSVREARAAHAAGKIATFIGIEGGQAIENDMALLRAFHRLGVRVMTLTWMKHTDWADSSGEPPRHHGLTDFGRQIIAEMNRLGMVIDLSHVSDETFFQALQASTKPVLVSHSCCRALCPHPRNVTDDMLRALGEKGGVIGINYFVGFLDQRAAELSEEYWQKVDRLELLYRRNPYRLRQALDEERERYQRELPRVGIERLVDHVEHAVRLAGIEQVALGSDFDGIRFTPQGLEDVSRLPTLVEALLRRGFSEAQVRKILGENLLRLFQAVIGE